LLNRQDLKSDLADLKYFFKLYIEIIIWGTLEMISGITLFVSSIIIVFIAETIAVYMIYREVRGLKHLIEMMHVILETHNNSITLNAAVNKNIVETIETYRSISEDTSPRTIN